MTYSCKCGWTGTDDEFDVIEETHCHPETGQALADLSYAQCPECGEEPDEVTTLDDASNDDAQDEALNDRTAMDYADEPQDESEV